MGGNGEARLFRPQKNMERLKRSAERMALPVSSTYMTFFLPVRSSDFRCAVVR